MSSMCHSPCPLQFLYDLVFDKDDPNFSGASKTHRDTRNRTMQSKDRNLGDTMTTNALTYTPPTEFVKPDYARKPVVKDTFYRGATAAVGLPGPVMVRVIAFSICAADA